MSSSEDLERDGVELGAEPGEDGPGLEEGSRLAGDDSDASGDDPDASGDDPDPSGDDPDPSGEEPGGDEEQWELEEMLEYLVRGMVAHPDEVGVERFDEEEGSVLLELSVAEDDYGKVIGRGGRTAKALRTVLRAAAGGEYRRVFIDIVN